ncbi:MAG: hypothetical protein U0570_03860 [Phycisphaerales bacterium]
MKVLFAFGAGCVLSAPTFAGVFVTSRVTTSREFVTDYRDPVESFEYDTTDTFIGLGVHNITMPHFHKAESTVSHTLVYAKFSGEDHYKNYDMGFSDAMTVLFNVSQAAANISITLNGSSDLGSQKPSNPQFMNAFFLIYNTATNAIVFDSWDIGQHKFGPPGFDKTSWTDATWNGVLAPGSYKVMVSASGVHTGNYGTDFNTYGRGNITATMTMIPGASTCGLLFPVIALTMRRRR